jgi:hypothetical protein
MKGYNNKTLKRMAEEEGKAMHNCMSNLQLAIPFSVVQPHVPPTFKHTLKELKELHANARGRLINIIHIYGYEKITRPIESGDRSRINLVQGFLKELRSSRNKKHTLNKKSDDFKITQGSLFSDGEMRDMVVIKKQEKKGQKPL